MCSISPLMELRIQRILSFFAPAFGKGNALYEQNNRHLSPLFDAIHYKRRKLNEEEDYTTMCDRPTA